MLDESLAKGLKNTLWRSAQKEFRRLSEIASGLGQVQSEPATRKGIRKRIAIIEKQFSTPLRLAGGRLEGRKPLWWFIMLTMNERISVNQWQENVFGFHFAGWRFLPYIGNYGDLRIRICEHAVSRLYQRAPQTAGLPSLDSIYPELACAGMHGFWHLLALRIFYDSGETYSAFVPTDKGAFLGEMSNCRDWLDLRTYIAKEQMRPEQLRLWDELRALRIDECALQVFPEYMLKMGADSKHRAVVLIQSLGNVMAGFPRLLGARAEAAGNTSS